VPELKAGALGLGMNFDTLLLEEEFGFKPRYFSMERGFSRL